MFRANTEGLALLLPIMTYIAAFAMALGPIPWIVSSEVFPAKLRGRAMSVATFTVWTSCNIVVLVFPSLRDSPRVGPALTFWIFAGCSLAALLFVAWKMPETKGRSLEEIERSWSSDQ
ncbi:MAG: sugar porter family MFS transporter [Phycisphaerae bacterium]|nr:sugar porter family MFS transporter [Phycisphaerae bacterium]